MPRIAHVISTLEGAGGAERVLSALVARGADAGYEQIIFNPFGRDTAALEELVDAPVIARPVRGPIQLPSLRLWLASSLHGFGAHVVHAHLWHAAVAVASLHREAPRVISHHHGSYLRWSGRKVAERLDRWAGTRFDRVIAVSASVRDFLIEDYGYAPERVTLIRNGWDGRPISEPRTEGVITLTCVANFRREKGHAVLLEAFVSLAREDERIRLVLAGDGPLKWTMEERALSLGINHRIEFAGAVQNVWPLLAQTDIFVLPSLYEPLGIVVMEAMAAGLPVVASRTGGIPELVEEEVTGILVNPGDATGLASSVRALISDPERRSRMGAAARIAAQSWTMEAMTESYYQLYEELAAPARSRPT